MPRSVTFACFVPALFLFLLMAPPAQAQPRVWIYSNRPPILEVDQKLELAALVPGTLEPKTLTWTVEPEGSGRVTPTASPGKVIFTALGGGAGAYGTVTVQAFEAKEHPDDPVLPGTIRIQVLKHSAFERYALVKKEADRHPDWLEPRLRNLRLEDLATRKGRLPMDPEAKGTEEGLTLGFGLPYLAPLKPPEARDSECWLSWGSPGGPWRSLNAGARTQVPITPDAATTALVYQTLVPGKGKEPTTTLSRRQVRMAGVLPLAGRQGQTGTLDGTGFTARFSEPLGMVLEHAPDPKHGLPGPWKAVVSDRTGNLLREVTSGGKVTTLAGGADALPQVGDVSLSSARFNHPTFLATLRLPGGTEDLIVADTDNHVVRRIHDHKVSILAGSLGEPGCELGEAGTSRLRNPTGLAVDGGGTLYIADTGNGLIRRVPAGTNTLEAFSGGRTAPDTARPVNGNRDETRFRNLRGMAFDGMHHCLLVVDGHAVRKVELEGPGAGSTASVAGDPAARGYRDQAAIPPGTPGEARLDTPWGIVPGAQGFFIADSGNHALRLLEPVDEDKAGPSWSLRTAAGDPGLTTSRYGLAREDGTLPPRPLRAYFAGLGSPRNLLPLPERGAFLVADGSILSLLRGSWNRPGLPEPMLDLGPLPATAMAGMPLKAHFEFKLPGTRPEAFHWALAYEKEDTRAAGTIRSGVATGNIAFEGELPGFPAPGDYHLILAVLAPDGSTRACRADLEVVPDPAGETKEPPRPPRPAPGAYLLNPNARRHIANRHYASTTEGYFLRAYCNPDAITRLINDPGNTFLREDDKYWKYGRGLAQVRTTWKATKFIGYADGNPKAKTSYFAIVWSEAPGGDEITTVFPISEEAARNPARTGY